MHREALEFEEFPDVVPAYCATIYHARDLWGNHLSPTPVVTRAVADFCHCEGISPLLMRVSRSHTIYPEIRSWIHRDANGRTGITRITGILWAGNPCTKSNFGEVGFGPCMQMNINELRITTSGKNRSSGLQPNTTANKKNSKSPAASAGNIPDPAVGTPPPPADKTSRMKPVPVPYQTTIAAIATPAGTGAISLIRISGPAAVLVADLATDGRVSAQTPGCHRHCRVRNTRGETLDDGLVTWFLEPNSYTGENCVEFTGHGGILVTREVLARFLSCGAVPAAPGEFTRRAFLNGKLDLTQAEGVIDLISAQTRLALRAARSQLDGILGRRTTEARDNLLETLAHLEAWVDFPEEDIDPKTGSPAPLPNPERAFHGGFPARNRRPRARAARRR